MKFISKKIGLILALIGGFSTILVGFAFPVLFPNISSIGSEFVFSMQIITFTGGIITIIGGLLSLKVALISGILVMLGGIIGGGNVISFVAACLILRERKTSKIKFDEKIINIILTFLIDEEKAFTAKALAHYCIKLRDLKIRQNTIEKYLDYLNKQGRIAMTLKEDEKFYHIS